jgi:L-iditol 2-dehydrogenase
MAKGSNGSLRAVGTLSYFAEESTMDMWGIQVVEIGKFQFLRLPVRRPQADEVLIRVAVAGLCRTDLKLIRVGHRDLVLPRIPGEEVVGAIVETGANVSGLECRDLVYVYPGRWCGNCSACRSGAENLCRDMRIMGFHRDGGFAEYVTVPAQSVIPVPEGLSADEAVFAEPLSCCLNALELAGLKPGMAVGIWGAGPAGTLLARAARADGANPLNIDPDPRRSGLAGGCERRPNRRFDVCVVAVGAKQAYAEAVSCLMPRGRMVVFSGLPPADDRLELSLNHFHYFEQSVVGAYGCAYRHGAAALNLIAKGAVPVTDMISHRMRLDQLDEAINLVEQRQSMKILLYPERRQSACGPTRP